MASLYDMRTNNPDATGASPPAPAVLVVRVLEACNAGCFMCEFAFSNDSYRFSLDEADTLVRQLRGTSVKVVRLTGGEPLLLPDLLPILGRFKQAGLLTSVITNGFYLPDHADQLASAGLDQVIVSIDGSCSSTHDRFRRCPGLFSNIERGIARIRSRVPGIMVRVNTVVGKHNLQELIPLYDALTRWQVDQWSIIPLKRSSAAWGGYSLDTLRQALDDFRRHLEKHPGPLALLGYSPLWAGRDDDEVAQLWAAGRCITPRGSCHLVDYVRYYLPREGLVFPCNCVPHRVMDQCVSERWSKDALLATGLQAAREWLREQGPSQCNGCEPINAALGEGLIDLRQSPLGF